MTADASATEPGRGAWLTPTMQAYETAVRRKAFRRALRLDAEPDTGELLAFLHRLHEHEQPTGNPDESSLP